MTTTLRPPRQGFTLIEVLVATLILGIIIAAVSTVIRTGIRAWRTGHGASEVSQTVRITQDVIMRDLDNLYYLTETAYNHAFRLQLDNLARIYGSQIGQSGDTRNFQRDLEAVRSGISNLGKMRRSRRSNKDGQHDAFDDMAIDTLPSPINLNFHGSENELSFTRTYRPRFAGDQDTWGVRRVTLYVRDKVLYRKEEDPFGLRVNESDELPLFDQTIDPLVVIRNQLQKLYVRPEDPGNTGQEVPSVGVLPAQVRIEEPLCSGVETFKIKYGYFSEGEWVEDQSWDSQAHQHRNPPEEILDARGNPIAPGAGYGTNSRLNVQGNYMQPSPLPGMMNVNPQLTRPDDLPGFISIQLGLRMADGKGRLYSFTIYHSLPQAQEIDVLLDDENSRLSSRHMRSNYQSTGGQRR